MNSVLENLHNCAKQYRESERIRMEEKNIEKAKKRKRVETRNRKERYHNDPEYREKILRQQREREARKKERMTSEELAEERAKKAKKAKAWRFFSESQRPVKKEKAQEPIKEEEAVPTPIVIKRIPWGERAECDKTWCMHHYKGKCVHRECIITKHYDISRQER